MGHEKYLNQVGTSSDTLALNSLASNTARMVSIDKYAKTHGGSVRPRPSRLSVTIANILEMNITLWTSLPTLKGKARLLDGIWPEVAELLEERKKCNY